MFGRTYKITGLFYLPKKVSDSSGNFEFFATYFNLMDSKGLSFQFKEHTELQAEKLFIKNGFGYFVMQHENLNELLILPNKNLDILTEKIVSKINFCNQEADVVQLVLDEMNSVHSIEFIES